MRTIEIDASRWTTVSDFLSALKVALGSCEGHGDSPDAFVDSMIWGGMNTVEAPYTVRVIGSDTAPKEVREYIELMVSVIRDARDWKRANRGIDTEVSMEIA
jgi:Barstar (barnase inhibitor)